MGIRPGIYVNGNYTANILQTASVSLRDQLAKPAANSPSVVAPAYPTLWVARWPNQANPNAINVQGTNPKDTYAGFYGPWDDYGDPQPWAFWQYASTGRLPTTASTRSTTTTESGGTTGAAAPAGGAESASAESADAAGDAESAGAAVVSEDTGRGATAVVSRRESRTTVVSCAAAQAHADA